MSTLTFSTYTQSLPREIPEAAAKSFIASGALTFVFTNGDLNTACLIGTVAATVSVIDSLVRPILNRISLIHSMTDEVKRAVWYLKMAGITLWACMSCENIAKIRMFSLLSVIFNVGINDPYAGNGGANLNRANCYVLFGG